MHIVTNTDTVVRILVAALLGSLVGYEREWSGQDAGFRTHILVSVGAAIFTIIQMEMIEWVALVTLENPQLVNVLSSDVTRLIAQIVSGIGFLGAGTIIVTNKSVKGLTTASSIWAIASIGMAAGIGSYFLAGTGTVVILITLHVIQRALHVEDTKQIQIQYLQTEENFHRILDFFHSLDIRVLRIEHAVDLSLEHEPRSNDLFWVGVPRDFVMYDLLHGLMDLPNIFSIKIEKVKGD